MRGPLSQVRFATRGRSHARHLADSALHRWSLWCGATNQVPPYLHDPAFRLLLCAIGQPLVLLDELLYLRHHVLGRELPLF